MPTTRKWSSAALAGLAALALALAAPALAQVYKWTDSAGKTHYGDKPPEDARKQELRIAPKSHEGSPEIRDWASILRRPAAGAESPRGPAGLTMFSAVWCGPCKRAKAYLAANAISYREVDIEASEANAKEYAQFGGGGIPLFIAGDKSMRGFSAQGLEQLLASARR